MLLAAAGFTAGLAWSQSANRWGRSPQATGDSPTGSPVEEPPVRKQNADLELIEQLLSLALDAISRKTPDVRLADVLKLLEFKQKLQPESDAQEMFWAWIERFRREDSVEKPANESPQRLDKSEEHKT